MNESEKMKLQGVLRKIDVLGKEIKNLIGEGQTSPRKKAEAGTTAKAIIDSISSLTANELENELDILSHKELGDVFVGVGGSSGDKRKPKAWLIERIMWLAKGFSESHKSIRGS